jgi:DNA-binding NarL/FixJ family response regulator
MQLRYGLIVEDLPDAREWLAQALVEAFPGIIIDAAASLSEARSLLVKQIPDLALIDIGLPDGSGIDLIDELNRAHPQVMSVVTSVFDDDTHLFAALGAGAAGYLLKDKSRHDLSAMLQKIADGQPPLSPSIARRLLGFFGPREHQTEAQLTAREREVLGLIAKGYSTPKVAELLEISRNTASGYVKTIYSKLNISSRAEAAMEASRLGIVTPGAY